MRRYYDSRIKETTRDGSFVCKNCRLMVPGAAPGTQHRNHCPGCLYSLHVDMDPGDRLSACHGLMEPIAVWVRKGAEWAIVHRCRKCGALRTNRIAGDDNELLLMSLAVRPLALPPFPLGRLSIAGKAHGHDLLTGDEESWSGDLTRSARSGQQEDEQHEYQQRRADGDA